MYLHGGCHLRRVAVRMSDVFVLEDVMTWRMASLIARVLVLTVMLVGPALHEVHAQSQTYTFERMTLVVGGENFTAPAINQSGVVTVRQDCSSVALTDGSSSAVWATTSPCGNIRAVLNNANLTAVKSAWNTQQNRFSDQILYAESGRPLVVFVDQVTNGLQPFHNAWSINDSGTLAFESGGTIFRKANGDLAAPIVAAAGPGTVTPIGQLTNARTPVVSNFGALVFQGSTVSSPNAIFFLQDTAIETITSSGANSGLLSLSDNHEIAYNDGRIVVADMGPLPRAPLRVIAVPRAVDAASPFATVEQVSINGHGKVAFSAVLADELYLGVRVRGIFTGPDPVADKVVKVGDVLPGGAIVENLFFSNQGLNDVGQIVFSTRTSSGPAVYRAHPSEPDPPAPGTSPDNPLLPPPGGPGGIWRIPVRVPQRDCTWISCGITSGGGARSSFRYLDPIVATGYRFDADEGTPNFDAVLVPAPLPAGDDTFEVEFDGHHATITAATPYRFTDLVPGGVRTFTISGISEAEALNPEDPAAFVTGLTWMGGFDGTITITPITNQPDDDIAPTATPSQTPATNANGWNRDSVTVNWNWTDNTGGSGIDVAACAPSTTIGTDGVHNLHSSCADLAGNTATATFTVSIDTTAPSIRVVQPASNSGYGLNTALTADYGCQDQATLSGLATCAGTAASGAVLDTTVPGLKTFTVTATDHAGNASTASVTYSVSFTFSGFLAPVDNAPVLNVVSAGASIPVKFSLGGDFGVGVFEPGFPVSRAIACNGAASADEVEQVAPAGSSGLKYDAATNIYSYVWKSEKNWAGTCRQLTVKLTDGSTHMALFQFKK